MKNEQRATAPCIESAKSSGHWRNFVWMAVVSGLVFSVPLYQLVRFAAPSELYSYILLVPFISAYLGWVRREKLPAFGGPALLPAAVFFLGGLAALAGYALARHAG